MKRETAPTADALTPIQAKELLDLVDVVRDPLHGDIRLTALERHIIDTPMFQRLRHINQLAMTYIAYPGALHTRFIHSIGTLKVAADMVETCNKNARVYRRLARPDDAVPLEIPDYATVLVRLCALMHDMAHIPFGHTLEKEGKVFETDEWQDPFRLNQVFGPESAFRKSVIRYLTTVPTESPIPEESAAALLADVQQILCCARADVASLPYPFVHDLVGNTICADLIDYVQRDMYFCGLRETIADRFLQYIAVVPLETENHDTLRPVPVKPEVTLAFRGNGKTACRVVLLQYRYNERRIAVQKHDIIAEAIDLVRRRLNVAEKLYFHRTKIAASAMLVAAVDAAKMKPDAMWWKSDAEVLHDLEKSPDRRAKTLAGKLLERKIFKPIYRAAYLVDDESSPARQVWDDPDGAYPIYKKPAERAKLVARLERIIGMECLEDPEAGVGTVAISCPDKKMNLKAFDMLVMPKPNTAVKRLQVSTFPPTELEIKAIRTTHEHLWRLEVFVDPTVVRLDVTNPFSAKLAGAIAAHIGPKNDVDQFAGIAGPTLDLLQSEVETSWALVRLEVADLVRQIDYNELVSQVSARGGRDLLEVAAEFLRGRGYNV